MLAAIHNLAASARMEVGIRTRRRPMGRDYAAAKDAEVGNEGVRFQVSVKRRAEGRGQKTENR